MPASRSGPIRKSIGPRKAHLLLLINNCSSIRRDVNALNPEDDNNKKEVTSNVEELIAKLETCIDGLRESEKQWQELIENLAPEEVDAEDAVYQTFVSGQDNHVVAIDEGRENLSLLKVALSRLQSTAKVEESTATSLPPARKAGGASKLPKLILPQFHGDVLMWSEFWAIFEANIHDTDLRGVEKLTYLRGQLSDNVRFAIDGLEITDDSYQIAVDILKKRYKKSPEKVINTLYSQLKHVPTSSNKVEDLQKTFDTCERLFRQLKTEGEDLDKNRSLVMDVMSKYPPDVLTEMSRRNPTDKLDTVGKAHAAFHEYIEEARSLQGMLTDLEPFGSTSVKPKNKPQLFHNNASSSKSDDQSVNSALTATSATSPSPATPAMRPCYFCGDGHFNSQCTIYPTIEDREKRLDQLERCRRCLSNTHLVGECRTRPQRLRCFFCNKTGAHVSPLCPKQFVKEASVGKAKNESMAAQTRVTPTKTASSLCLEEQSVLSTATATVVNPTSGCKRQILIILDSGSHRSYVTEQLAQDLHLTSNKTESLKVAVFGSKRSLLVETKQIEVSLCLRDGSMKSITAHTTPIITNCPLSPSKLPPSTRELIATFRDAMADDFDAEPGPPDLLVGSDYFWEFVTGACIRLDDGIHLIPSKFGLILGGRFVTDADGSPSESPSLLCLTERQPSESKVTSTSLSSSICSSRDGRVCPDIDEFWSMERIGISDDPVDKDDIIAQQRFNETVSFKNGRYHVSWPWKKQKPDLPTNYQLAVGRLRSLAQRFDRNDNHVFSEYSKVITDQLSRGIIEEVPVSQRWSTVNTVHYLPHHPVIRVNSDTTKVRVVYDASAKIRKDKPCLNECLYRGPVILPNLCSILLRFRLYKIAMVADIEKAFLQLGLNEEDRDVTRFIWFEDWQHPDINRLITYRFTRVCFGVISSPFLLGATIYFHLTKYNTVVALLIRDNTYVDNAIFGAEDTGTAKAYYDEAKSIFNEAGMNLREWTTSSSEVNSSISESDRSPKREVKVLGLSWDHVNDSIAIQGNWDKYEQCKSKREVLQAVASFYDPLGLFQPCIHSAKCFLRDLWKSKFQWDDVLPEDLQLAWKTIHETVSPVFNIKMPRHIQQSSIRSLIAFADASGDAYAAAIYLRTQSENKQWVSTLVFSKSRLAPRNASSSDVSLPRLELLGVLIAVRAVEFVRTSISPVDPISACILSDSSCVLGWIKSDKPLPVFVSNRVEEIRKIRQAEFHHLGTSDNPADLATRGKTGVELANSELWWNGPSWLQGEKDDWPTKNIVAPMCSTQLQNIEQKCGQDTITLLTTGPTDTSLHWRPFNMKPTKYSSILKILRITVICLKFLLKRVWSRLDTNIQRNPGLEHIFSSISLENNITSDELQLSRKLWIKSSQWNRYSDVIKAMQQSKRNSLVKQLNLFIDREAMIRCGGRMRHADLPEETIEPLLLPKDDDITVLFIRDCHARLIHSGVSHTLSQIRRLYWIPQGRNAVRKVLNRCILCRKFKGAPFALPRMPPWPRQRVARAIPFQYIGLDYLGPINVSLHGTVYKMWVCLFTCLTVRAIHLEPVIDCTAKSFIDCLSRFISRRGCPEEVVSDNAPQFRLAKNLLDRTWHNVMTDDEVTSYFSNRGVRWKFTTELAPWQGGVYERLVGVVKGVLRVGIGRQRLEWTQLVTLLCEVEAIVNSRPITYVRSDHGSGSALRPIDFLSELPTGVPEIDPNEKPTGGDAGKQLIRYWKLKQRKLDTLWNKWYSDYLLSMRERGQVCHKTGRRDIHHSPSVNDVVLVKEPDIPRGMWKLGMVAKLLPSGEETNIRSAELRMPNGQVIRRPLNHLYQLEIPTSLSSEGEELFDGFEATEAVEAEERVQGLRRLIHSENGAEQTITFTAAVTNRIREGLNDTAVTLSFSSQ